MTWCWHAIKLTNWIDNISVYFFLLDIVQDPGDDGNSGYQHLQTSSSFSSSSSCTCKLPAPANHLPIIIIISSSKKRTSIISVLFCIICHPFNNVTSINYLFRFWFDFERMKDKGDNCWGMCMNWKISYMVLPESIHNWVPAGQIDSKTNLEKFMGTQYLWHCVKSNAYNLMTSKQTQRLNIIIYFFISLVVVFFWELLEDSLIRNLLINN